jgi:hypothetical protein
MNEEQIRKIVREEMDKNYANGSTEIPPHSHNGTDALQVSIGDVDGILRFTNKQDGVYEANTFVNSETSIQGFLNANSNTQIFPVPVFYSGHLGSFEGGVAPEGTVIVGRDGAATKERLWAQINGEWFYVDLTAV